MKPRDYTGLMAELEEAFAGHAPKSAELSIRAKKSLIDGVSHTLRYLHPFPPRITSATGAYVVDEDGNRILDFWQGHFTNILGHNPRVVAEVLAQAFSSGSGLQTGYPDRLQAETAEILCRRTGCERVRFTTSGALATMYAILLSRAYTGRELVMKVGGGWHGAHPWGLKGVGYKAESGLGYQGIDSAGLPPAVTDKVVVTRFNDPEALRQEFKKQGDKLACFIVEPFIGSGGMMPASPEFIRTAREWTERTGTILILDEVIAGFRFRAGNAGKLFGIQPDLSTFGKVMGGGMPVAAVGGRSDIMELTGRNAKNKVSFSGGTYSAHPASLLAAKTMMTHLVDQESNIYTKIAAMGERMRKVIEDAFASEGIYAYCTGRGNEAIPGGSLLFMHFPFEEGRKPDRPDDLFNPTVCDTYLSDVVMHLAFLVEDVHLLHGHGAVSAAHTEQDAVRLEEACRRVIRRLKKHI
ncbi:MAG: aminotransferase class III-fold pyridoxal phosphate-dependent enzyme [Acidobacteria bacterium]|nr:aminotransferase class III-fold pyridoxal phosphate-dependent enzyme [Acidobacteriota bacterium]